MLEVENGLFNDPELQINSMVALFISPVLEKLANNEGRNELKEPIYEFGNEYIVKKDTLCNNLLQLNEGIDFLIYQRVNKMIIWFLTLGP